MKRKHKAFMVGVTPFIAHNLIQGR